MYNLLPPIQQDLKKFNFYYWFAFPALLPVDPFVCEEITKVDTYFTKEQVCMHVYVCMYLYMCVWLSLWCTG